MAEQEAFVQPPEWWFEFLMNKFDADVVRTPRVSSANTPRTRRDRLELLNDYYIGDPPLPFISDQYKGTFEQVMRKARANYATMSVDVMTDRSVLMGVATETDGDADGDDIARQIQEASGFAAVQRDVQSYLFAMGEAYVTVIPPLEGVQDAVPMMIAEDPRKCVGQVDPINPQRLIAAVKYFDDELRDSQVALLFVENNKYTFRREEGQFNTSFNVDEWTLETTETLQGLEELGGVPIVKFTNKMGLGEFEAHIDLLDRIMDGILQRIVIQWYQSFRQRAIKGDLDGGEDFTDEDGSNNLIKSLGDDKTIADVFQADPGSLWMVPENVEFWESQTADLTPLISAIRDDVKEFAASTRTPLHIITPDAANGSAEGAGLMREGLVDKINDRQARQTPGWTLAFKIAFAMAGQDQRAKGIRLLWAKTIHNSLQMKADAMAKTKGILSRNRQVIEIMEFDPYTAKLNETELIAESMLIDGTGTDPNALNSPVGASPAPEADPAAEPAEPAAA
ncbi:phage portal protein [Rhodococcus qingshengii]|uniref:Phage portal protein n=1 Tax=Rhodococcus qingshengii TaxID=334542 RepID=A0AAW6LQN1_RHOSG|nr:phage portal protein [Rhodococcus qingshengii]MDE8648088.1 phage portal protein [Rhodococcus qingshengii]